jgi:uncharacterized SAM-binding protein YcdF (DUF218 family)
MQVPILFRRVPIAICLGTGLVVFFATATPFVRWYGAKRTDREGDTLSVPGGGDLLDGIPSQDTLFRCIVALRTCQAGHFRKIVLVGPPVSAGMRDLVVWRGVPMSALVTEEASQCTRENALYAARLLMGDRGSKVRFTADCHMFRAARAFRKAGVNVLPRPIPSPMPSSGRAAFLLVGALSRMRCSIPRESPITVSASGFDDLFGPSVCQEITSPIAGNRSLTFAAPKAHPRTSESGYRLFRDSA